jgi:hypothetical protein
MHRLSSNALRALLCILACASAAHADDTTKRELQLDAFTAIESNAGVDVDVQIAAGPTHVVLEGETSFVDKVDAKVAGGKLTVGVQPHLMLPSNARLVVHVQMPTLERVLVSGSGDVVVKGALAAKTLDAVVNGSGAIEVAQVTASENVNLVVKGSGDIQVAGKATRSSIEVSGSGDVKADGLATEVVRVALSGSGDVAAQATKSATGTLSGSGDITVFGQPAERSVKRSGSGTVVFR